MRKPRLPKHRCPACDNGIQKEWAVCAWCGYQIADCNSSLSERLHDELLELVKLFAKTVEYYIRLDYADGDDEGARLKTVTLIRINHAIRVTEARAS